MVSLVSGSGNMMPQTLLGEMYFYGNGVKKVMRKLLNGIIRQLIKEKTRADDVRSYELLWPWY